MAYLVLKDKTIFEGNIFGKLPKEGYCVGEVVFNTGMTGYQEVLTDPSYCGQIVTMTYPLIGNYGVNSSDTESAKPQVFGFIVSELCKNPGNWMSEKSLNDYLYENNICGITDIDTRALTRKIRSHGTMMGVISNKIPDDEFLDKLDEFIIHDQVKRVTSDKIYTKKSKETLYKVGLLDFGYKANILRSLVGLECDVTVLPADTKAETILEYNFDGLMLSNGPGDPKDNADIIENLKVLIPKIPIFGICLGHQLLALAAGGDTKKMKFGHRGCNHPVKDLDTNKSYITSQNHGYSVIENSLDTNKLRITHTNLNDQTVEGLEFIDYPVYSVQFHPEACPGPRETAYLFKKFIGLMEENKNA